MKYVLAITLLLWALNVVYLQQQFENDTLTLIEENDILMAELAITNKELSEYTADKEYIMALGASEDEAIKIIKASKAYNISPK